ncbi:MAG: hypothetical protein Hens3KO_15080 [Henriciella sp.]
MAKAMFHRSQRVYVKPVGTYALVEKVIPHWTNGVDQPLRVTYDVGLGREFGANELISEEAMRGRDSDASDALLIETWRILRQPNRWQSNDATSHHPYPGTYPVVVTDEYDWGGWRVPGAEYNRDPSVIEHQARMIVNAPDLVRLCKAMIQTAERDQSAVSADMKALLKRAGLILRHVYGVTDTPLKAAE